MHKRVVITGAGGNLGRKLSDYLEGSDHYRLTLLDRVADATRGILAADLAVYDLAWLRAFEGADLVVHLAANPDPLAPWHDLIDSNIDATLNVYLAAVRYKIPRVVFASSVWVSRAHRFDPGPRDSRTPPDPGGSAYGATKLFGERIGKAFSEAHGVSTVAVRLGACKPNDNRSETVTGASGWTQDCWLSDRDMCRGIEAASNAPGTGFAVVNLISANASERWDLREAEAAIHYRPLDAHVTQLGLRQRARAMAVRLVRRVTTMGERLAARDW